MGMGAFTWIDIAVVGILLLGMLFIGYRMSRTNKTPEDYILGGRSLPSGLVGLSMFATLFSTLSYLSYPGETVRYGFVFCAGILSFPLAWFVVRRWIIPKFIHLNVSSAYEILELRLGRRSRRLATVFFLSLRYLWMSTIIYATVDTALVPILGIDPSLVPLISIVLVLFTVLYTTWGGLKAVVYTDALQSLIMFLGVLLTIGVIWFKVGDPAAFFDPAVRTHWLPWDWTPRLHTRMTAANIIVMNGCWQIMTAASDQMAIQRYLSVRDGKAAGRTLAVSLFSSAAIQVLLAVVGLMVLVYFTRFPQMLPDGTGVLTQADQLFPRFILVGLPTGVTGLIVAALIAAAMSSLSSGLNSSATVIQEDILKQMKRNRDRTFTLSTIRRISAVLGLFVAGTCFCIGYVQGNLLDIVIKVVNLVVAPLFVLFFMALFVPRARDGATAAGGVVALCAAVAVSIFGVAGIAAIWTMPLSFAAGAFSALLLSICHRKGVSRRK